MKTTVPEDLGPGLTDQQLECLHILLKDGDWHDRAEIGREIKNYIPANISGRIIRPLEERGLVEQEERPVEEGSKKKKKVVRIRKDSDERILHSLIMYSANNLVVKYLKKGASKEGNFYLKIRNESIKRLRELEKQDKLLEKDHWKKLKSQDPDSQSWQQLVALAEQIAEIIKQHCKPDTNVPSLAFLTACKARPDLFQGSVKTACQET